MTTRIDNDEWPFVLIQNITDSDYVWITIAGDRELSTSAPRAEFLAAVAAELDVIVVPRSDLPEVTVWDDISVRVHHVVYTTDHKGDYRADALARLAIAEYIEQHPPVDQAQVDALTAEVDRAATWIGEGNARDLARRLLATGRVTVVEAGDGK